MSEDRRDRIEELVRRGAREREDVVLAVLAIRAELARRRTQWKIARVVTTGLATAAAVAYKFFSKSSVPTKFAKAASALSLLVSAARAAQRIRRFW